MKIKVRETCHLHAATWEVCDCDCTCDHRGPLHALNCRVRTGIVVGRLGMRRRTA